MEQKKYNKVNLEKKRGLYSAIGLLTALTVVLSALEYRTIRTFETPTSRYLPAEIDIIEIMPISFPKVPAPPKKEVIRQFVQSILIDDNGVEEPIEFVPTDFHPDDLVLAYNDHSFPIEIIDEIDPIVMIPDVMPEFPGGFKALTEYLSKEMKYPAIALRNGTSGMVNLSFVVDKEGNITDVKVVHSIGGGCDEEAVRVVEAMPKWKPGKQGGQKVKVQYYLPLNFKLK